eukprot:TRINITY_DN7699_c0_g1_i1.p1 TRINITY_DN7699_c0_g1~~TRINITY_DN7699_c0_g1_i1.p1  ORF type:complete len:171 (-),score=70.71 TRINITY_DN7699_c0_g1_i1:258-746(-)
MGYDPAAIGETYEAGGPQRLTRHELLTYMYALTTRTKETGTFKITELMMDPATMVRAFIIGKFPFGTVNTFHQYNLDRLERDSISDMSEGLPDLTDLGVKMHTLEDKMPWELAPFDKYSYYHYEGPEEKPVVPPPTVVTMDVERKLHQKRGLGPIALVPGLA